MEECGGREDKIELIISREERGLRSMSGDVVLSWGKGCGIKGIRGVKRNLDHRYDALVFKTPLFLVANRGKYFVDCPRRRTFCTLLHTFFFLHPNAQRLEGRFKG